jgi:L-aspartate oxidase
MVNSKVLVEQIVTDFLVVGAGVAGLRAAIELAPFGRVLIVAKDSLKESSSQYAQGGIAAALADDDEISLHEADTMSAGAGLCRREAVHVLVEEGPVEVRRLIEWGADFDRDGDHLLFAREGAHSRSRVLHAHGDSTGREIARTLYVQAADLAPVEFHSFSGVLDLLVEDNRVCGALASDEKSGRQVEIRARAVLLATGGMGCVFSDTTNPDVATGDGVALAYRAGADVSDLEFVQFHPTALHVEGAPRFLLSEALRGEGAFLLNAKGERFMERYHPLKELAPRDVVSRAIVDVMRGEGSQHVYLDLSHHLSDRGTDFVRHRFPRIHATCLAHGIDLDLQAAPVRPAAHYAMGGVTTDLGGRTNLEGLYAAGEAACTGVHGANRLASNSLLEGLVFGARAARSMASSASPASSGGVIPEPFQLLQSDERAIRQIASEHCGILRSRAELVEALSLLNAVGRMEKPMLTRAQSELRNLHTLTLLIARAALAREESRGAHQRLDFPATSPAFEKHSHLRKGVETVSFS